ncbi:MAG TPA: P1 family peptidase [Acidimicrobiales bacterium]|nr:P1 family peptidase [Acidimicrobiales bacterium]
MITAVPGVRVGHWTDERARTGCTVILLPEGTVASGEVRGGAPGTREWALLAPERTVSRVDAVVLTGGSAFGLAACDGVVRWCEERGIGVPTPAGPVPIVVGAVLFDLLVGDPTVRPDAAAGYAACVAAAAGDVAMGPVGAGAGATVGLWQGLEQGRPAGVGTAAARTGELVVAALVVVNAFGDLRGPARPEWPSTTVSPLGNTTIGVVATNATVDKLGCFLIAQSAHDGLARALEPAHTTVDGDAMVAASVGGVTAPLDQVRFMAARVVEDAIRSAAADRRR